MSSQKSQVERFDDLYKWILTPTSFLIGIMTLVARGVGETTIEQFLVITAVPLIVSVFLFIPVALREKGRLGRPLRFFSFALLLFSLGITGFTVLYGVLQVIPIIPGWSDIFLVLFTAAVSLIISRMVVNDAYKTDRSLDPSLGVPCHLGLWLDLGRSLETF